jgi:hypothetical protein
VSWKYSWQVNRWNGLFQLIPEWFVIHLTK